MNEAQAAIQPATIVYGFGRCPLATHRDFRDEASGQFVCGFNPSGNADDTVLVARATDDCRAGCLATFVNYACHPTTLAWENQLISPDYPGAMREVVERAMPAPCVFLQGASGDLGPREGFSGDHGAGRSKRTPARLCGALGTRSPAAGGDAVRIRRAGRLGSDAGSLETSAAGGRRQDCRKGHWRLARWTVNLPYRPELPTRDAVLAARERFEAARKRAERRAMRPWRATPTR